jgi:hypothetical protein
VYEFTMKHFKYPTENTKAKSTGPGELGYCVGKLILTEIFPSVQKHDI